MSAKNHTVSQVARRAHVTVRTLHHYDEVGILVPSGRSRAGYRLYSDADLARLHHILLFARSRVFAHDAIAQVVDEPLAERCLALRLHGNAWSRKSGARTRRYGRWIGLSRQWNKEMLP